jgi:EpsI family protein
LHALDATSYLARNYRKGENQLDLFVAFYEQQRAGESMHSPKHCLPGAGWEIWQQGSALVTVNGKAIEINQDRIENLGSKELMFYWYQSRNRIIASEYLGKLFLARDTLVSGQTAGSIVRIILPDTPGSSQEGAAFAAKLIPAVWRSFGRGSQ